MQSTSQTTTEADQGPKTQIEQWAKQYGCPQKDLLVLARGNDPFNTGTPTDFLMANWFAEVFGQYGFAQGVHLRRIHYKLASLEEPVLRHDGEVYENTERCWDYLCKVGKKARYLGTVDSGAFVDRRNPNPVLYAPDPVEGEEPRWYVEDFEGLYVQPIHTSLFVTGSIPEIYTAGYNYSTGEQPYYLECWSEKSTMDDIILPLCSEYGVNYCPAIGFQSYTNSYRLIQRILSHEIDRPVRVFYISDFDPSGDNMPVAVARHIEFTLHQLGINADIKLTPLLLTRGQVDQYQLPCKPIKETDRSREAFQRRYGVDGAVELDALEAIHPGEFGGILADVFGRYRDDTLSDRLADADRVAQDEADTAWSDSTSGLEDQVQSLVEEAEAIQERYSGKLQRLHDAHEAEIGPIRERLSEKEDEIREELEEMSEDLIVDLPERPQPEINPGDESEWLYDSTRDYGAQLQRYHLHKRGVS